MAETGKIFHFPLIPTHPLKKISKNRNSDIRYCSTIHFNNYRSTNRVLIINLEQNSPHTYLPAPSPQLHPLKYKVQNSAIFILCALKSYYIDTSQATIVKFFDPPLRAPITLFCDFSKFLFVSKIQPAMYNLTARIQVLAR